MTQPLLDPATKRAPSASRLAGSKREEEAKKVPATKLTQSVAGKTPLR